MSAVLLDVAHAVSRNVDKNGLAELRDVDTTLLKVRLTTDLSGWVELGSTRTVRVPSAYLGAFPGYFAASCHSQAMLAWVETPCN